MVQVTVRGYHSCASFPFPSELPLTPPLEEMNIEYFILTPRCIAIISVL